MMKKECQQKRLKEQIYQYCDEFKIEEEKIEDMINGRIEVEKTVREYFYKYCLTKWRELKRSSKLLQLIESD